LGDDDGAGLAWRHTRWRRDRRLVEPLLEAFELPPQRVDLTLILLQLVAHLLQQRADLLGGLHGRRYQQSGRDSGASGGSQSVKVSARNRR
jgi:hypothetical protein